MQKYVELCKLSFIYVFKTITYVYILLFLM